jgi:hypothetical protein
MQSSHHLQVETDQATSTRDISSSRTTWLVRTGLLAFGCFGLGFASTCLVVPSASQADSQPANHAVAFAPMGMPLRANPATAPAFKTPSSFLSPQSSHTSVVSNAEPKRSGRPELSMGIKRDWKSASAAAALAASLASANPALAAEPWPYSTLLEKLPQASDFQGRLLRRRQECCRL